PLTIHGGTGGTNRLAFSDANRNTAVTATLTATQLQSTGWATISYDSLASFYFEGSRGADTINVLSTARGTSYIVNGDGGSDTFTLGNTTANFNAGTPNGTLANLQGDVTVWPDYNA